MSTCRFETLEVSTCFDSVYLRDEEEGLGPYGVLLGGLGPSTSRGSPSST